MDVIAAGGELRHGTDIAWGLMLILTGMAVGALFHLCSRPWAGRRFRGPREARRRRARASGGSRQVFSPF